MDFLTHTEIDHYPPAVSRTELYRLYLSSVAKGKPEQYNACASDYYLWNYNMLSNTLDEVIAQQHLAIIVCMYITLKDWEWPGNMAKS